MNFLRHLVIILCLACALSRALHGDSYSSITTPNGSTIETIIVNPDYSQSYLNSLNYSYTNAYPLATYIMSATKLYNCHAAAWPVSMSYWIDAIDQYGRINIDKYWMDGSYTAQFCIPAHSITQAQANLLNSYSYIKLHYGDDHSARVLGGISTTVIVRSKWGPGPYMEHLLDYCPYGPVCVNVYTR
jgi:hypothetical protein